MKKIDFVFILFLIIIITLLIVPITRIFIGEASGNFPYLLGFIKTAILATYGEMIASRIATKNYFYKKGLIYRFTIWGFLGMAFVLVFKIFDQGVRASMTSGLLISPNSYNLLTNIYIAFTVSFFMNLIFAPTFMILHRFTDTFIDLGGGKINKIFKVKGKDVIDKIDWQGFFGFVVLKTIPLFWIPAHTITFLLPENYRILSAGFLSIALGLILTLSKMRKKDMNEKLS
ncbi:MAG: hypothetical protein RQ856_03745 [Candidatus Izemoplasmatales bacterium]|nr:hypothetical protein [Candidatus Izemoplasmatales bacterium]